MWGVIKMVTKFQNYRNEADGLVRHIERLPNQTNEEAGKSFDELYKTLLNKLSKKDKQGRIIQLFPLPQKAEEVIDLAKKVYGSEYGEELYKRQFKPYFDDLWSRIQNNIGDNFLYDIAVSPIEQLVEGNGIKLDGKLGSGYSQIKDYLKQIKKGNLNEVFAEKVATDYVNELDLNDKTKEFLKKYIVESRNTDVGLHFYKIGIDYKMADFMSKNAGKVKDYAVNLISEAWEKGKKDDYIKLTDMIKTTTDMDNTYQMIHKKLKANA